jgi:hypothetical protein
MPRASRIRNAVACGAAVATGLTALAPAALAGADGQEIQVKSSNPGTPIEYLQVCGTNQRGRWVCTPIKKNVWIGNQMEVWGGQYFTGYWFKRRLNIWSWERGQDPQRARPLLRYCYVPTRQRSNWYVCDSKDAGMA